MSMLLMASRHAKQVQQESGTGGITVIGNRTLLLQLLQQDEAGGTLMEYALLLFLIALLCIGAVAAFGSSLVQFWTDRTGQLFP